MKARIGSTLAAMSLLWAAVLAPGTADAAVSSTPAPVPRLATSGTDGSVEQIRQIVQCGQTMYAVGTFSQIQNGNSTTLITRNNAFAFSATAPYLVTAWNPNTNGIVDTVACSPDGTVLLGGAFTSAGGAPNRNVAKVNATTGASIAFGLHPTARTEHIEVVAGHALVGGDFPGYLTSVSPYTGASDGYTIPTISGTYSYPGVSTNRTHVWNMTPKSDATAVLVTGVFTSVGGQHHEQVVRLNVAPGRGTAVVSAWAPTELESHCATVEPFYAKDAAWAPDGSHIYVATTGYKPFDGRAGATPRTGPCDAAISYPTTQTRFNGHTWINYTGCDSYYSVAADTTTVFTGGHQRWVSNPSDCDEKGPGAIDQPGLAEFNPANGTYQPGPNRARGLGADDLLRTATGLWVASDNMGNGDACNGQHGHLGLCYFPN